MCADCLAHADKLSAAVHRRNDFGLLRYLPSAFLQVRSLVGCQDRCVIHAISSTNDPGSDTLSCKAGE